MEKQVIYQISETTQAVINGLMKQISEQNQTIENLQNKLEATTEMLIKYYNKVDEHWFDQTVSF